MYSYENNRKHAFFWNALSIIAAVAIVMLIAAYMPHKGSLTTVYFEGKAVSVNDIRTACVGSKAGTIVQLDPSITINCGR